VYDTTYMCGALFGDVITWVSLSVSLNHQQFREENI